MKTRKITQYEVNNKVFEDREAAIREEMETQLWYLIVGNSATEGYDAIEEIVARRAQVIEILKGNTITFEEVGNAESE